MNIESKPINFFTRRIIDNLGCVNPLYIYGNGDKSEILREIYNYYKSNNKNIILDYSQGFMRKLRVAKMNREDKLFEDKYKNIDILLIDDIQYFSTKAATQDVLYRILDFLYKNNKVTVATSDVAVDELDGFYEIIKDIFKLGKQIEINCPLI